MTQHIIFGAQRDFMLPAFYALSEQFSCTLVRKPEQLNAELLKRLNPSHVILPDWSWLIPEEILQLSYFVGFHSADLPNYRGGSPLQHQIIDGLEETKLSCFRMTPGMDDGPLLCQETLDLSGTISDIWERIASFIPHMASQVVSGNCEERPQTDGGFSRSRRKPSDSELNNWSGSLKDIYNHMRAVDTPYPNVFYSIDGKRLSFSSPTFDGTAIQATVTIRDK